MKLGWVLLVALLAGCPTTAKERDDASKAKATDAADLGQDDVLCSVGVLSSAGSNGVIAAMAERGYRVAGIAGRGDNVILWFRRER